MSFTERYRLTCTLSFGDIYGQIIVWLIVIFASVAAALGLMDSPLYAFFAIGLILVLSLPFLLFAFVTTLLNHIEFTPLSQIQAETNPGSSPVTSAA
ncbi:MAG: hypothetical protein HC924_09750 [Synechococcaceae cyanobacterium SM2_3_2]|nr:hypothetical protein [Synechococcaceae cyanobacterium SM2_3_2]